MRQVVVFQFDTMARRPVHLMGEAIAALLDDSDDDDVDLVILPPEGGDGRVSDIEQGDEENLESSRALPAETAGTLEIHTAGDEDDAPAPNQWGPVPSKPRGRRPARKTAAAQDAPRWRNHPEIEPMEAAETPSLVADHPEMGTKTPIEVFRMFWDEKMCEMIITETNRYARQNNDQSFRLTREELDQFLGILLLTGYVSLPRQRMYWEKGEDVHVPIIGKTMARHRFERIKRHLHFADNEKLPTGDKIAKVRPLFDELNRVLLQFGVFHDKLSIDEQMVPYFGHHSSKMYMKGKPVRFGFKLWVLASSDGYPYCVEMYAGKNAQQSGGSAGTESLGLGGDVVLRLLECVQSPLQHEVFFDNYFSSYALMAALRQKGIRATGTVRDNRLKNCPLPESKTAEGASRGDYWYQSTNGVLAVKWKDNKAVTLVTNHSSITPLRDVQRWSKQAKKKVTVKQPNLIHEYNQHMGGVDLVDGAIAVYRPALRWNKWYGTLVINVFGLLRVASWRMYRNCTRSNVDQLTYTREIAMELLKNPRQQEPGPDEGPGPGPDNRPGPSSGRVRVVSKLPGNHYIVPAERQGRCKQCLKNTRTMCNVCDVRLHSHCSQQYHT